MNRLKRTLLVLVIATVAIVPATAFASGGHHGHHGKFQAYRGTVAAPTATSPLVVSVTHGSDMTFVLTPKTRYIVNHQRLTPEPSFTTGERVVVKARELKNGTFVARAVWAMTKKA
jgi:hypothetical protein